MRIARAQEQQSFKICYFVAANWSPAALDDSKRCDVRSPAKLARRSRLSRHDLSVTPFIRNSRPFSRRTIRDPSGRWMEGLGWASRLPRAPLQLLATVSE
jgi:hypothetical protein